MSSKKTALVVAPGRGTYNKEELGYLARHHSGGGSLVKAMNEAREALGQETVSALDEAKRYSISHHTRGDNASPLIYACAYSDFDAINRDEYDVVAVTGNSMGWYIALACAGALDGMGGFQVVNTMGKLMQEALIGGQLLYPFVDENWVEVPGRREELLFLGQSIADVHVSIHLGGMIVFAGSEQALASLEEKLEPMQGRFPMRLGNHAAFHTPLQAPVAKRGQEALPVEMFKAPTAPLIDGRGHIWERGATNLAALWDYTFNTQVLEPYNFTAAITTSLKEFAPDALIILGPGATLGGAVAQTMIHNHWQGLGSKADFLSMQTDTPFVLSMGIEAQRELVV